MARLPDNHGFQVNREKGSVRYYTNPRTGKDVRVDFHGSKEVPSGTLHTILKQAGMKANRNR